MNLMTANNQWATRPNDERYESLDELFAAVSNRRMRSKAADITLAEIESYPQGNELILNRGHKPASLTHWAFGQLCTWIHAPAGYLRNITPDLASNCVNHGIKKYSKDYENGLKFMTILDKDGGVNTMQAVTSTTYGRIWDADCVSAAIKIQQRTNGKFYNPKAYVNGTVKPSGLYASDRDVFIFMIDGGSVFDAGPRAQINRGVILWNSEVGSRTFSLMTFLFNQVCGNHIIWGATDINKILIRHTKNGPARFEYDALPKLMDYAKATPELSAIEKSQQIKLISVYDINDGTTHNIYDKEWQKGFSKKFNFTVGELNDAIETAEKEESRCHTLWDLVQGFTASAREYQWIDARIDLEQRAGKLLEIASN